MSTRKIKGFGAWQSTITSASIASGCASIGEVTVHSGDVYWIESRPWQGGRYTVVRQSPDGRVRDVTADQFNARTRVHEYGGGAYLPLSDGIVFSNFSDGQLYIQPGGADATPLTNAPQTRYADFVLDPPRNRLISVCEDHSADDHEPLNTLVEIAMDGGSARVVARGADFYSSPRISPDGAHLCWMEWDHPNMPWDGCRLMLARIAADGAIGAATLIAGAIDESIFQPEWSPDGVLYFVSDRSGWWNLYRFGKNGPEPVCSMDAEFGAPQWVFGMSTYGFCSAELILCAYNQNGLWSLAEIETATGKLTPIDSPYTEIRNVQAQPDGAVFCGASPTESACVVRFDRKTRQFLVLSRSSTLDIDRDYLSGPEQVEFPTENGLSAHGFFYPPKNPKFAAPGGELPPLIVISHGGPTSAASTALNLGIQHWTSRGFAVLDVNYGGSTGFGRKYRERLNGTWGIVDVDDCVNGALHLAAGPSPRVDNDRLIIRGGSAGGYTTLAALTFKDVFRAGASYYGISDLEALEQDGHKFESRYSFSLVAPYPEGRELYYQRSPIHYLDRLSCPIILFQGLEDKVVPPNQAEMMFEAVRAKGLPVAYVPFEGEQHGFRKAENIKRSLDAELYFYSRVFNFSLADPIEPVHIENLDIPE